MIGIADGSPGVGDGADIKTKVIAIHQRREREDAHLGGYTVGGVQFINAILAAQAIQIPIRGAEIDLQNLLVGRQARDEMAGDNVVGRGVVEIEEIVLIINSPDDACVCGG